MLREALRPLLCLVDDCDDLDRLINDSIGHSEGGARYHKLSRIDDLAGMSHERVVCQSPHRFSDALGDLARDVRTIGRDVASLVSKLQAGRG